MAKLEKEMEGENVAEVPGYLTENVHDFLDLDTSSDMFLCIFQKLPIMGCGAVLCLEDT